MTDHQNSSAGTEYAAAVSRVIWRHKKRGTTYQVMTHFAALQCASDQGTEDRFKDLNWTIYRSREDNAVYVRLTSEFMDGRFERVGEESVDDAQPVGMREALLEAKATIEAYCLGAAPQTMARIDAALAPQPSPAATVEELRAFCRPLLGDVGSANDRAFERLIAKLFPLAAPVETKPEPGSIKAVLRNIAQNAVQPAFREALHDSRNPNHERTGGLRDQAPERCSADRESERKDYAEAWHRQIIKAGADENVAQQAITIAALVGLFDYFNERPSAEGWQIQQSVPSDGFECYYLLRNGITVAEICGRQTDQRTRQLTELIAAANRAEPQTAAVTRPAAFLAWAVEMFGPVAKLRGERLMRFIEEAVELAHADEMERATLDAIANRVYSRPPGEIPQEIGQAQACLETYAENIGECSALQAEIEWHRVQTVPVEEVRRRHRAKQEIGIALSDPSTVTRPHGGGK